MTNRCEAFPQAGRLTLSIACNADDLINKALITERCIVSGQRAMLEKIACVVALLASLVGPAFSQQAQKVERTPAELEYFKEVVSLLLKARRYPPAARLIKLEGRAVVFFHVDPDGQITSRRILESSGHAMLDQAALETVDRVNPLPPFPPDLKKTSNGNFAVPIRFEWR